MSDTHGYFDPVLERVLRGAELIVHAGDIGNEEVLTALSAIAPVTAIRGNVDEGVRHPATALVLWRGLRLRLVHSAQEWTGALAAVPADVLVCGHTHQPEIEQRNGMLVVNPGSAGRKRFNLPRTCARLWLGSAKPKGLKAAEPGAEIVHLDRQ